MSAGGTGDVVPMMQSSLNLHLTRRDTVGAERSSRVGLVLWPITHKKAAEFVSVNHRHCVPSKGWKFGVGVSDGKELVGVAVVGRPVARALDDGFTLEITRVCTKGERNACSMLYGASRRAAFALGHTRIVTYTLESELGTSLLASGFVPVATTKDHKWDRPSGRRRIDCGPPGRKIRWESVAPGGHCPLTAAA